MKIENADAYLGVDLLSSILTQRCTKSISNLWNILLISVLSQLKDDFKLIFTKINNDFVSKKLKNEQKLLLKI